MRIPVLLAEVMDKEPTLAWVWTTFAILGLLGTGLALVNRWLVLLVFPVTFLFAWILLDELHDPFVGPAIVSEAGRWYVIQCYLAILLGLAGPSVVLVVRRRRLTV